MHIGIDIGGTTAKIGLTDENGKIQKKITVSTGYGISEEKLICRLKAGCLSLCPEKERDTVSSIGIGVPGTLEKESVCLTFGPNLGIRNVNFGTAFQPWFHCPVFIENDANCAALAELYQGNGIGLKDFIVVTLGTGVGGGIVLGGELYTGFNHIAGEIGHMVIADGGQLCNCGKHGCLEAYASSVGLIRMAKEALEFYPNSELQKVTDWGALVVFQAKDRGDPAAEQAFDYYIHYLACGLNNLIAIMQFEKILIGGGISGYGEKLLNPLQDAIQKDLIEADCPQTKIELAGAGNDAGIIGAAMLKK